MSEPSPITPITPVTPSNLAHSAPITAGIWFKRKFRPYFTKRQLATLGSLKKSGVFMSKEISARISYCKFIQDVGKKLGL